MLTVKYFKLSICLCSRLFGKLDEGRDEFYRKFLYEVAMMNGSSLHNFLAFRGYTPFYILKLEYVKVLVSKT